MGDIYFYHLTRRPLESVLPMLLERALHAGWRVAVRGPNAERLAWLNEKLWLGPEEQFLPHGLAGDPHEAWQPVLLTTGEQSANNPDCVMCIDGAEITADAVKSLSRVCILFDGRDESAVQHARGQWKTLTDKGCAAQYWSEDSGKWEKKAESGQS